LKRREVLKCGAAFAVLDMAGAARAQDVTAWTAKPVRLILPFTPGGGS
jgi:tripartite-type tricarboxylate transporter receptor subunit TctC